MKAAKTALLFCTLCILCIVAAVVGSDWILWMDSLVGARSLGVIANGESVACASADDWEPVYAPLSESLESFLEEQEGRWSLYFKDLDSGLAFGIDPDLPVPAASCVKVPVVLYASTLVSQGLLRWSDRLTYNEETDWCDGAGSLQHSAEHGDEYTVGMLCNKAIVESDNIAWQMLERTLGRGNIAAFMKSLGGALVYPGDANVSTAKDMVTYMEAALRFSEEDPVNGLSLMRDLQNTIWNDGLNGLLAGEVPIGHKEGCITGVANDVGVVYTEHPYILSVMSKDQEDLHQAFARIAEISKIIWSYQVDLAK